MYDDFRETMTQGKKFSFIVTVTDEEGLRIDLTPYTNIHATFKRSLTDTVVDLEFEKKKTGGSGTAITLLDQGVAATKGQMRITVDPADTEGLPDGFGVLLFGDVELETGGGASPVEETVIKGRLYVDPAVSA